MCVDCHIADDSDFQVAKSAVFAFERPDRIKDSSIGSGGSSSSSGDEDGFALLVLNFVGVSQRTALF